MTERKVTTRSRRRPVTKPGEQNLLDQEKPPQERDEYAELVRTAAAGDRAALEQLLLRAQAAAWRFSRIVCGGAGDAEDAMQEALIKTYRYVGRIRQPEAFRPWLYRTVRNACLMGRRKKVGEPAKLESLEDVLRAPERPRGLDIASSGLDPEQLAANATLRRRLRKALESLPPAQRAVVVLREMEGLSTREVAGIMGISEDNVKTRLHRARLQLQASLDRDAV
jgi:RNA polymerase sigma-70 factor (ECF subfamily)